ncbi:hypothetical protein HFO56_01785 [Rhizobium laguerreae]|uniref:hypothetical protein n=1 Tax=Rhizobium laguerreae TaxID=1076926 RepID=UPI001C8FC386|nr:hypothetical protein [Rhizobium laguerreae]MBY3151137.1 hypothetical protein [Rhizobium laguerreae]
MSDLVPVGVFDDIPRTPDEDFIPVERQRAEMLGPDFDPHYFDKLGTLIEESYGPLSGEYQIISGRPDPVEDNNDMTGITTRGDETLDASKKVFCDFCGAHAAHERFDELKFCYGQNGVILSAIVAVTECTTCGEAYSSVGLLFATTCRQSAKVHRPVRPANNLAWKQADQKGREERFGPITDDLVPAGERSR